MSTIEPWAIQEIEQRLRQFLRLSILPRIGAISPSAGTWVCSLLLAGILLFSGSLYILALSGITALGAVTPLGGLAFLAAWFLLAFRLLGSSGPAR